MQAKQAPRRRHGEDLKKQVLAECAQPGASVAAVALAHGLNANLVHKWRRGRGHRRHGAAPTVVSQGAGEFVELQLPAPSSEPPCAMAPDIRIELRRGATAMNIAWPATAAGECAAWLREWLR